MKNTKNGIFVLAGIVLFFSSSCGLQYLRLAPYYAIYYEQQDFPGYDTTGRVWSLQNEKLLMRGIRGSNEKRNAEIVNKYYLGGALFAAGISAKNETTTTASNPYRIYLLVYVPNKDTSITIKNISVNSPSGNDLSYLANHNMPVTMALEAMNTESGRRDERFLSGVYSTEAIFNLKKEPIIVKFDVEVSENDNYETGTIVFEFIPIIHSGLIRSIG
jgi:hypothetical protein